MQTQIIPTQFRSAFENIKVGKNINAKMPEVGLVFDAIQGKQGYIKRNEWNANLSFGTFQRLKGEGVVQ